MGLTLKPCLKYARKLLKNHTLFHLTTEALLYPSQDSLELLRKAIHQEIISLLKEPGLPEFAKDLR